MKAVSIQGKQFLDDGRRKYSAKYFKWKISQNQRNQASCIQRYLTIQGIECRHFGDMASSSIFF